MTQSTSSSTSSTQQHETLSSTKTSEMKANALKRDLNEIKSSMNEINNIAALSQNPLNTLQDK